MSRTSDRPPKASAVLAPSMDEATRHSGLQYLPTTSDGIVAALVGVAGTVDPADDGTQLAAAFAQVLRETLPSARISIALDTSSDGVRNASPPERLSGEFSLGAPAEQHVPVFASGRPVGTITVGADSTDDLDHAVHVANVASRVLGTFARFTATAHRASHESSKLRHELVRVHRLAQTGRAAAEAVHEMNNPLAAITAYAEMLVRRVELDPSDRLRAERIREAANRVHMLARRLLSQARSTNEPTSTVSVAALLHDALAACEHLISGHPIEVEQRVTPRLPPVRASREAMVFALTNLIANACHAIGERGGRIVLGAHATDGAIVIRIADDGCGIAPGDVPRLFEPFFTTRADGGGTGLGLSIVRHVIDAHGGTIRVDSTPGRGSCFEIELPAAP